MSGVSNARRISILNTTFDVAGNYLGLFATLPGDDGLGGAEVSGGPGNGYARVSIGATNWQAAVAGALGYPATKAGPKAGIPWTFNACLSPWDAIEGFGIFTDNAAYDPTKALNLLAWGDLAGAPIVTITGSVLAFSATPTSVVLSTPATSNQTGASYTVTPGSHTFTANATAGSPVLSIVSAGTLVLGDQGLVVNGPGVPIGTTTAAEIKAAQIVLMCGSLEDNYG